MIRVNPGRWWRLAVLALVTQVFAGPSFAEEVADFYAGRTVTILIGHPPGGSYDIYAQLAAPHLGKHIPGNPTVIVQGMPGGGGSLAAAFFANKAPRDGTMLALLPESLAHTQLLEPKRSRWDVSKMRYIGRMADVTSVMMVRRGAPVQTFQEMLTTPVNVSCSGRTTTSAQSGAIVKSFTDAKFNMVCGYDSSTASILALFRGEADLTTTVWTTWTVNHGEQLQSGEIKPLIQFGAERLADLPDVPTAIELVDDPQKKQALEFFGAGGDIGRALLAPPELPDDKVQALSTAFEAMVNDPEFKADAAKRSLPLAPAPASEVNASVEKIFSTPEETVTLLKAAMESGF